MGTQDDMAFRANHPRVDDGEWQSRVEKARAVIKGGAAVNGKPVMRELKNSEVPTVVSESCPTLLMTLPTLRF
jgi:hypothetical protein